MSGPSCSHPEDRRGLTPLFWQHVLPYGEVTLDMTTRLSIRAATPPSGSQDDPGTAQLGPVCPGSSR